MRGLPRIGFRYQTTKGSSIAKTILGGLPQWDGLGEQKRVDLPSRGQESLLRAEETATIFRQTEFFPQLRFARG